MDYPNQRFANSFLRLKGVFSQPIHCSVANPYSNNILVVFGILGTLVLFFSLREGDPGIVNAISPQATKVGLYVAGCLILVAISVTNLVGFSRLCQVLVSLVYVVAILIFWNAVEIHWVDIQQNYFLIGGLIPSSDADEWLTGGWRLLESGTLSTFDQRRPINAAIHALRLFVTGDLQGSIVLAALFAGLVSLYGAILIRDSFGWIAGIVYFLCILELIGPHLHLTMTEVHGFIFGSLAFCLIWRAAITHSTTLFITSLAILSIGLSARSGPFLLSATIFLWGMFYLLPNRSLSLPMLIVGLGATTVGFGISKLFILLWADGSNIQNSNFALTLYGMSVGGKGWTQAFRDYPDLFRAGFGGLRESEIALELYSISINKIIHDPLKFLSYYFHQMYYFIKNFIHYELGISRLLLLVSGVWLICKWRDRLSKLCLFSFLGIWLSSPFLMADAGVRPFAPVYAAFALMPALSAGLVVRIIGSYVSTDRRVSKDRQLGNGIKGSFLLGMVALALTVIGPVVAVDSYRPLSAIHSEPCPKHTRLVILRPETSVLVNITRDDRQHITGVPYIRYSRFLETFPKSQASNGLHQLENTRPPFSLVSTYIAKKDLREYLILINSSDIEIGRYSGVCVTDIAGKEYQSGYNN